MVRRIGYGALAIVVVLAVITSDVAVAKEVSDLIGPMGDLLRQGSTIPIFMTVMFVIGAVELNRILCETGARPHSAFAYLMTGVLMLTPWLSAAGWLGYGAAEVEGIYWQLVGLAVAVIGTAILTIRRREPKGAMRDMNATLMIVVFLGFLGSFGVQIRCSRDTPGEDGAWLLLIVVLVAKAADIGGYLVGSLFGRHKLIPSISPAKSIEGAVGGMLCSAAVAVAFAMACSGAVALSSRGIAVTSVGIGSSAYMLLDEMTRAFSLTQAESGLHPAGRAFLFGTLVSIAAQIGDLVESCFKRDAGIKDSGNVIPRFGGILDLIDSLVLALPVGWFLLTAVWNIV